MDSQPSLQSLLERIAVEAAKLPTDGSLQPEARNKLRGLLKQAGFALETPIDTMDRVVVYPFLHTTVRIGINLGLFEYLIEAGQSGIDVEDLAAKTKVDQDFLGMFDFMGPVFQKLPEFLAKNQYRSPTAYHGPLQLAYDTNKKAFGYILEPQWAEQGNHCNLFMQNRRRGNTTWLQSYPFSEEVLAGVKPGEDSVVVVDVGGGLGQALFEIKGKFPDIKGRLVLQDQPSTVKQAGDGKGVFTPMGHDFFNPQPIKGARAYLLRQVLHDWPDQECQTILRHIAAAIHPGYSKILIDDMVMPDMGAPEKVIIRDITMLGMSGGLQRTERQWANVIESAGLRIKKIWPVSGIEESIIEVVPL
ncbi:MAG: hypothetical protein Q9222_006717 [Ikaeria aurantiellina]